MANQNQSCLSGDDKLIESGTVRVLGEYWDFRFL